MVYEDVKPCEITTEGRTIDCNTHFLGVSWASTGGSKVAILDATKPQRVDQNQKYITGHQGAVCDVKFSPFQTNLLATCSDDATVRVWELEKEGLTKDLSVETQKYSVF
jgi:coronin-2